MKKYNSLLDALMGEPKSEAMERIVDYFENTPKWNVDLERTQRILLGLDSEEMEFSEASIGKLMRQIANEQEPLSDVCIILHAVANALLKNDDDFHLVLKHNKRGKFLSPHETDKKFNREMSILYSLASLENKGMKTEAAVAQCMEWFSCSRSAIFLAIENAEKFLADGQEIFPGNENFANPRSKHSAK
jgi:hypothetical protein